MYGETENPGRRIILVSWTPTWTSQYPSIPYGSYVLGSWMQVSVVRPLCRKTVPRWYRTNDLAPAWPTCTSYTIPDGLGNPSQVGVGKTSKVRAALLDFRHIVMTLASHPTHVSELVEYIPKLAGICDGHQLLEPAESESDIRGRTDSMALRMPPRHESVVSQRGSHKVGL